MITRIEIKDMGIFKVNKDMTHRTRCYLKLDTFIKKLMEVQFNSLNIHDDSFQMGYDKLGNTIYIKILTKNL